MQSLLCSIAFKKIYCTLRADMQTVCMSARTAWPEIVLKFYPWILLSKYLTSWSSLCPQYLYLYSDSQWMRGSFLLTNSSMPSVFKFTEKNENWKEGRKRLRHRQESTNRLAMVTFWCTFHDGKFSAAWWGWRVHAFSLYHHEQSCGVRSS